MLYYKNMSNNDLYEIFNKKYNEFINKKEISITVYICNFRIKL